MNEIKTTIHGIRPFMEDDLWPKTTFDGRRPFTEETFDGRGPLTEDDLWRRMTFDGRRPLMEDDFWRRTTFDGRWPLTEDYLWQKTTFDGRQLITQKLRSSSLGTVLVFFKVYSGNGQPMAKAQLNRHKSRHCPSLVLHEIAWAQHHQLEIHLILTKI